MQKEQKEYFIIFMQDSIFPAQQFGNGRKCESLKTIRKANKTTVKLKKTGDSFSRPARFIKGALARSFHDFVLQGTVPYKQNPHLISLIQRHLRFALRLFFTTQTGFH